MQVDPLEGEYMSVNGEHTISVATWVLLRDPDMAEAVKEFAHDADKLDAELGSAWVYLMNADRFDGPTGNVCSAYY